jgi:hypothetical protein
MKLYLHVARRFPTYTLANALHVKDFTMRLFLQFGYGMMEHCKFLVREWGQGTVILSPRDLGANQLERIAKEVRRQGGSIMLDPQLYLPDADHVRLTAHEYWPKSPEFWTEDSLQELVASLARLNTQLEATAFILPGVLASRVDDDWLEIQRLVQEEYGRQGGDAANAYATVALSSDAARIDDQVEHLLDAIDGWEVGGLYLVFEHPNGEYLVGDPGWLANCLDVVAGARLAGKQVVLGYCNHQMLIAACAGADALASGTWMNVRSFPPSKFRAQYEEEIRQRATWYYAPHLLSEYKVQFLDLAQKLQILPRLRTPAEFGSTFADELFEAPQPSLANFTEQGAFRHYLNCLHTQVANARQPTFDATVNHYVAALEAARTQLTDLMRVGVSGQNRDFGQAIDAGRGALAVLQSNRGAVLRRSWGTLGA